mmetsp:Transcript_39852/g.43167  ORF Transcript_39852/g.43167 Transcript_39852/m.43167 type:complete len:236 (-) Transcript_39852:11-718(-)
MLDIDGDETTLSLYSSVFAFIISDSTSDFDDPFVATAIATIAKKISTATATAPPETSHFVKAVHTPNPTIPLIAKSVPLATTAVATASPTDDKSSPVPPTKASVASPIVVAAEEEANSVPTEVKESVAPLAITESKTEVVAVDVATASTPPPLNKVSPATPATDPAAKRPVVLATIPLPATLAAPAVVAIVVVLRAATFPAIDAPTLPAVVDVDIVLAAVAPTVPAAVAIVVVVV